jgi:hypothetical protein
MGSIALLKTSYEYYKRTVCLENLLDIEVAKKLPLIETECSLPYSQKPAFKFCSNADKFRSQPCNLTFKIYYNFRLIIWFHKAKGTFLTS